MKTTTKDETIYRFTSMDDIDTDIFTKAKEENIDINTEYSDWYDYIDEDLHRILGLLGYSNIESYFSGFYSQGDGASFEADWTREKYLTKKIKDYAPKDEELHQIAKALMQYPVGTIGSVDRTILTRYYHSNTMTAELDYETNEKYDGEILEQCSRDLANWYYKFLEEGHDYLQSDESILETFIVNEYEFNEDGGII